MTVPFAQIPSNLRTPLFYAEIDASRANTARRNQRTLIIGQMRLNGTLTPSVPIRSLSLVDGVNETGPGSIITAMVRAYRQNDQQGELWVLPLRDDAGGTAATGTITFTGPTTAVGTLALYIAGQLLPVVIASGQTEAQVATTVAAAINAFGRLPVTAAAAAGVVTLTAKNRGECGNDIDIRFNYLGLRGGETLPAGLTVAIVGMSGGAINPSVTAGLANLNDEPFDFIVCALTDAASLTAIAALLNDSTGRWSWAVQTYGHCFIARRGTAGTLAGFATGLNNQHLTCIGYSDSPSPPWVWAAAIAGASAVSLRDDPGVPLQFLTVAGVLAPPLASRFNQTIRNNTLLYGGVSTWTVDATNTVVIENLITTYVTNAQGDADDSYLQVEDLFVLMYILRRMRDVVQLKYARRKLADDGARPAPGSNVVTPSTIRADIIAAYGELEVEGMVQQSAAFAANLIVEKNAQNPNRVDVLWPAVIINQLRVFALLAQFRHS